MSRADFAAFLLAYNYNGHHRCELPNKHKGVQFLFHFDRGLMRSYIEYRDDRQVRSKCYPTTGRDSIGVFQDDVEDIFAKPPENDDIFSPPGHKPQDIFADECVPEKKYACNTHTHLLLPNYLIQDQDSHSPSVLGKFEHEV